MSSANIKTVLEHLTALVSFDTQNPPREIDSQSAIFNYLQLHLPGFEFTFFDAGDGCLSLLAKRGNPSLLFNFHIDTVPVAKGWSSNPFELVIKDDKATGLGACDIKGASACMLSAVAKTTGDVALLFSSDEEHGSSTAIKYFLNSNPEFKDVIVSEPTQAKAVLAHRGIQTAKVNFTGISGHGSAKRAMKDNAIHKAGNWISSALEWVEQQTQAFDTLTGLPFNIGKIDGGVKANMIAADCELAIGFRPLPGQDADVLLEQLQQLSSCSITAGFYGPTLPSANQDFAEAIRRAELLAKNNNLAFGQAVDFWTEASLFSNAGMTALVYGPGDIAQAHTADEWVLLEQLELVEKKYQEIISLQESTLQQTSDPTNNLAAGQAHE
ncbi:MAG: acetylornithine deacetylase [Gammaproteobacteria bacterium]|nr:MAG: acetylornithine deacetylase [Gammaproteobacteria bacterium]